MASIRYVTSLGREGRTFIFIIITKLYLKWKRDYSLSSFSVCGHHKRWPNIWPTLNHRILTVGLIPSQGHVDLGKPQSEITNLYNLHTLNLLLLLPLLFWYIFLHLYYLCHLCYFTILTFLKHHYVCWNMYTILYYLSHL